MSAEKAARLFARAAASVPESVTRPAAPDGFEAADQAWVQPRWATRARPVRRYLAARAFGAWSAYLGEGLRSQVAMLAVALAVLRVEAARQAAAAARLLDETLLHAAIRSSDQLLQHTSNLGVLVESVAPVERLSSAAFLDAIGLKEVE